MYIVAQAFGLTDSQNKSDVTYMYMYTIIDMLGLTINTVHITVLHFKYHISLIFCEFHVFNYAQKSNNLYGSHLIFDQFTKL